MYAVKWNESGLKTRIFYFERKIDHKKSLDRCYSSFEACKDRKAQKKKKKKMEAVFPAPQQRPGK